MLERVPRRLRGWLAIGVAVGGAITTLSACPGGSPNSSAPSPVPTTLGVPRSSSAPIAAPSGTPTPAATFNTNSRRGFPDAGPWVEYDGAAADLTSFDRLVSTYRIIVVDADPDKGLFKKDDIARLSNGGVNRVLARLSVFAVSSTRSYWTKAPGFVPPSDDRVAKLGKVAGSSDETWVDPTDPNYRTLFLHYIAKRLADQGVDGFVLDRLELLDHLPDAANGPCSAGCRATGLSLLADLRKAYPDLLFVVKDATSDVIRLGSVGTDRVSDMLDGVMHTNVYAPTKDDEAEYELRRWAGMGLTPGGHPFWLGTLDYVGDCGNTAAAKSDYDASKAQGFNPYVSDKAGSSSVCYF